MDRWLPTVFAFLLISVLPLVPAEAGILDVKVIAATGTVYEWLPGGVMLDIYSSSDGNMIPIANNSGHLAWSANLRGQNVVFTVNDQALFRRAPDGTISMLARKGEQVPGAPEGAKWLSFAPTCLTADGTLYFRGRLNFIDGGGGVTNENDYVAARVAPNGSLTVLAREGLEVPGLPSHTLKGNPGESSPPPLYPRCNADGQATFVHPITEGGSDEYALFHVDPAGNTTVAWRTGDTVPGLDGGEEFLAFAKSPLLNGSGQLTFRGVMQAGEGGAAVGGGLDTGLFGPGADGQTTLLMREGDAAPDSPQGVFENIHVHFDKTIAADGAVAFIHSFKYNNWYIEDGLWRHDPANPGVLTTEMVQGAAAAGLPEGWSFGSLVSLTGNAAGRLAVQGNVNFGEDEFGDPLQSKEAVWVQTDAGVFELVAVTGEKAPGTGGATLQTINNALLMNASGQTTFAGTLLKLEPVTNLNDYGLWIYTPNQGLELLLREGTEIAVGNGDIRTVSSITQSTSNMTGSGGADGLPIGLTDEGKAAVVVHFTGSAPAPGFQANAAVVVASVTPDPCDPDKINCDDEDACTEDSCDSEAGCLHVAVVCDDEDACTDDSCDMEAGCQNVAVNCDDSDGCTADSCDAVTGCQHAVLDCNDNDACTDDSCAIESGCQNVPLDCSDEDACTVDTCDVVVGCLNVALDCDDENACSADSCDTVSGCQHVTIDCDDLSACTEDSCAPELGCQYEPVNCDDENFCSADTCDPDSGCSHSDVGCDDGNACTDDSCDPPIGCEYTDVQCDDCDLCTDDFCDTQTGCGSTPVDCDDMSACTIDSCEKESGCQYEVVVCEDDDACTVDSCNPAMGCENVELKCDDNIACTIDTCNPETGCINTDMDCNDDNPCTLDSCEKGKCLHKKDPDQPLCCVDDGDCHDGDICTADSCVNKLCEFDPLENCCAKDMDCSDGLVCTVDLCDQAVHQCKYLPMEGCCMADDECSGDSQCIEHQCRSPWCSECGDDGDCTADGASCVKLLSGSYCLASCGAGCPDGYECDGEHCLPAAGDCECVAEPGQLSCDGNDWVKADSCGQFIEVVAACEYACAAVDGCCEAEEFSVGGQCVETPAPDTDDTDVITSEDMVTVEEIVEVPEVVAGEDVPPAEEDAVVLDGGVDSSSEDVFTADDENPKKGGGDCTMGGTSTTSLWLLLALFAVMALARFRRLAA